MNNHRDPVNSVIDADPPALEIAAVRPPLRVMFIITAMFVGGAETLLDYLMRRLDRQRFAPELCCLKTPGELGQRLAGQIPVHSGFLRHKFDVRVLPRLTRLLRRRQIDAVVTVGAGDKMFWGRLAARSAGVPIVVSAIHSTGWPDEIKWLNRRLTRVTDAFVAVAAPHARYLVDEVGLPARRTHVIPNGVDTDRFRPQAPSAALRRELNIPSAAPIAGIVALLRPEKNHELFLRVAERVSRQVPDAHFLIIGDGPRRAELQSLTVELGLADRVRFLGHRTDVPDLLNLLDVFVLTSQIEANPVSILEALSTATPTVATRVGSVGEVVIHGKSGYLVEPGDEQTMARHLTDLLHNPALAERFGAHGRRTVLADWSVDAMIAGYERLLEQLRSVKIPFAASSPFAVSWPEHSPQSLISIEA